MLVQSQSDVTQLKRQLEQLQLAKDASTSVASDAGFDEQAALLQQQISSQLERAADATASPVDRNASSTANSTTARSRRAPALSRMTKAQLTGPTPHAPCMQVDG